MSGGAANAAIYFANDFINESKKAIKGRQSAHEGFLKGFARYAQSDRFVVYAPNQARAEQFAGFVRNHDPLGRPIEGVSWHNPEKLSGVGALQLADPCMLSFAWSRRQVGDAAYSLIGVIHTLSSEGVVRMLRSYPTAPLFDWDALICTSEAGRKVVETAIEEGESFLAERFGSTIRPPRPQLPVIPLGVHVDEFAPTSARKAAGAALRRELGVAPDEVVFLFFGRLSFHAKAHPMVMMQAAEMAAHHCQTPIRLLFVGQFPNQAMASEYQALANALCRRAKVTFLDGADLPRSQAAWSASDVFLSLSDNIQETFGLTIIEAMAAGLPVIASDWNGYRQGMIHGQTGMMIPTLAPPPGAGAELARDYDLGLLTYDRFIGVASQTTSVDVPATAAAISTMARDPELRAQLGHGAAQRAQSFDWRALVPQYHALWAELAARRASGVPMRHQAMSLPDPYVLFENYPTAALDGGMWLRTGPDAAAAVKRALTFGMNRIASAYLAPPETLRRLAEMAAKAGGLTIDGLATATPELPRAVFLRSVAWLLKIGAMQAIKPALFDGAACKEAFEAGLAAYQAGDKLKAASGFRRALVAQPDYEPALRNLIVALKSLDALTDAAFVARAWAARRPDSYNAWHELARALLMSGDLAEARGAFERALEIHKDDGQAWNGYGLCLRRLGSPAEARAATERALELLPNDVNVLANLGNTYLDQHRPEEALVYYRKIMEVKPNALEGFTNIGAAERRAGRIMDAASTYKQGVAFFPDDDSLRHNMSMAMLGSALFTEGWDSYRCRPSAGKQRRVGDRWTKETVAGKKVLVEWEQGLGDEIFFLRFWGAAAELGADLYYRPNPKLKPLLERSPVFAGRLVEINAKFAADITIGVGDLPWLTGHVDRSPAPVSITLTPEPHLTEAARAQLAAFGPPPYIGVAWRGGTPDKGATLFKETPLGRLAALLRHVQGTIVMVQRRPASGEVEAFQEALGRPALDCCAYNENFEQIFALVALLDDLVGVSNTNVHLRAAVGKGCRVLIPNPPDFRWMQDGARSPWFPHSLVYRQKTNGDWSYAYQVLARDLGAPTLQADPADLDAAKAAKAAGDLAAARRHAEAVVAAVPDCLEAWLLLAGICLGQGGVEVAVGLEAAKKVLALNPAHAAAWNLQGTALQVLGRNVEAVDAYRAALSHDPSRLEIYVNLGSVLGIMGRTRAADEAFEKALAGAPETLGVWTTYAHYQFSMKNYEAAEMAMRKAAALQPDNPTHWYEIGLCQWDRKNFIGAVESIRRALSMNPPVDLRKKMLMSLVMALTSAELLDEADALCRSMLQSDPLDWRLFLSMSEIHFRKKQDDDAISCARKAGGLAPTADNINEVNHFLSKWMQHQIGNEVMRDYHPKDKGDMLRHCWNYGGALTIMGLLDDAGRVYQKGLSVDPEDRQLNEAFGMYLLFLGMFKEGWRHYLFRRSTTSISQALMRSTLPEDLSGRRILLGRDQGVGDEIFFLRFARELKRRGAWIGYVASPMMAPLARLLPELDVVALSGSEIPGCDMRISLGDLPAILDVGDVSALPGPIALTPNGIRVEALRTRLAGYGPGPYLAVAWQAGLFNGGALYKRAPHGLIADVIRAWPGTCLNVQRRPLADDVLRIERESGRVLHDVSDLNDDLVDMLALMSLVDEMVCVSNTNVHLRATLGKSSRVLVPMPPDFRWMWSGDASPWYPDHRVYRQLPGGDWTPAGRRLLADLQAVADSVAE